MCKIMETLEVVRQHNGFPGLGFKKAAQVVGIEPTAMRFALEAYREPVLAAAVDAGTITDPKVIGQLHKLPAVAAKCVARIEARLGRKLSRTRALKIAQAFDKVQAKRQEADAFHDTFVEGDELPLDAFFMPRPQRMWDVVGHAFH